MGLAVARENRVPRCLLLSTLTMNFCQVTLLHIILKATCIAILMMHAYGTTKTALHCFVAVPVLGFISVAFVLQLVIAKGFARYVNIGIPSVFLVKSLYVVQSDCC